MARFDYLIIGGGIAGTSAAETLRKNDPNGSIAIISEEPYRLYSRILLSKPSWFLGKMPHDKVWLKDDQWYIDNNIDLFKGLIAEAIDPENKTVTVAGEGDMRYGKLLLATGACARPWPVNGADKKGVFYLRTYDEALYIQGAAETARKAVAIGGGFISFEVADLLRAKGLEVHNIIREPHFWDPVFDKPGSKIIEKAMEEQGVKIWRNSLVEEVLGDDKVEGVRLKDGTEIECDLIVCGIGVVCMLEWLKSAGINTRRGVLADEFLQTNKPDIWVAGDAAEYKDIILDEEVIMGSWSNAQKQGEVAALNMLGSGKPFEFVSFYTATGFGVTIAFVGDVWPHEHKQVIARGPEGDSYARIILLNGEVVGGCMINRNQEMGVMQKLIESNLNVADKVEELADPKFDLKSLLTL